MKKLFFVLSMCLFSAFSLIAEDAKPLYQLPEKKVDIPDNNIVNSSSFSDDVFLVGSDLGLYKVTNSNTAIPVGKDVFENVRIDQIFPVKLPTEDGKYTAGWLFRTAKGIYFSEDLVTFEERNKGLTFLTIKKYENKEKVIEYEIKELKDLAINPLNNNEIVTATKDEVFYSKDCGKSWTNIGSMSANTTGMKAVAVATIDGETVVFMSHPIYGFSYKYPNRANAKWIDITRGFVMMKSLTSADEIADILPVVRTNADGSQYIEIYISQSFMPCIYKLNWEEKKAELIYRGEEPVESFDGLTTIDNVLLYTKLEGFGALDFDTLQSPGHPKEERNWHKSFASVPGMVNTAWIPTGRSGFAQGLALCELWLLYPGTINTPYAETVADKKSIYISAGKCITQEGIDNFIDVVKSRNMNSIVIDMKDDYGLLRYDTHDPLLLEKGVVSSYAIPDLNHLISEFKKEGIYLIARIPVFKDKKLSQYAGGKYAVWDAKYNKPWQGIRYMEDVVDEEGNPTGEQQAVYYDEHWVDPYSEEVWEYNITIAQELIERGFDEIQFDYIRFPTDGINLRNVHYRWRDPGMDKESALLSFLKYARANIDAPIGIDIYGANGWYRSGTRTGQDAEMLAEYVDVIGPMFYPSHFEESFLNYEPVKDRTYRVYYYGTFRNTILCRNRAVIRPWVQSFYLGSSRYDRMYYDNSDYIKKQFWGVQDSVDRGYMCWNNSGKYGATPPDIAPGEEFTGTSTEHEFSKKPAIGQAEKPLNVPEQVDVSILDSILYPNYDQNRPFTPFLQVLP